MATPAAGEAEGWAPWTRAISGIYGRASAADFVSSRRPSSASTNSDVLPQPLPLGGHSAPASPPLEGSHAALQARMDRLEMTLARTESTLLKAVNSLRDEVLAARRPSTPRTDAHGASTYAKDGASAQADDTPWASRLADTHVQEILQKVRAEWTTHSTFRRKRLGSKDSPTPTVSASPTSRTAVLDNSLVATPSQREAFAKGDHAVVVGDIEESMSSAPDTSRHACRTCVRYACCAPVRGCRSCLRWVRPRRCLGCVARLLPVLNPETPFSTCWSLIVAMLICWCAISVPLELAFEDSARRAFGPDGWSSWEVANLVIDSIFITDIAISFRTGYLVDGRLQRDGWKIAKHYLRGSFLVDLLGAFPINFILPQNTGDDGEAQGDASRLNRNLRMLRIIKLNRLLRLSKLSRNLKGVEMQLSFNPSAIRVFKLLVLMWISCLWMGCLWWFVADVELSATLTPEEPQNIWQPSSELLQASLGMQVAAAIFWGSGFISATVPMDVVPFTEPEYYVTAVCGMISLLFNAFVIGSMASALSSMDSKKQVCRGKMETIGHYLLLHNVPTELRAKILEYYEYLFTSSQQMEDLHLVRDLPASLGTRLSLMMHHRIMVRGQGFFSLLSDHALLGVLERLKSVICVPAEVITLEGRSLLALQFIQKGLVRCISKHPEKEAERTATVGDSFGLHVVTAIIQGVLVSDDGDIEAAFGNGVFDDACAIESASAITYCSLVSIPLAALAEVLRVPGALQLAKKKPSRLRRAGTRVGMKLRDTRKDRSNSPSFSFSLAQRAVRAARQEHEHSDGHSDGNDSTTGRRPSRVERQDSFWSDHSDPESKSNSAPMLRPNRKLSRTTFEA